MNHLKTVLLSNALFSAISALVLIIFSGTIASLFSIENKYIFTIIGGALLVFSATIVVEIKKQRLLAILWIIVQDTLWVIASLYLLIVKPFPISSAGNTTISVVALIVFFLALYQTKALAQADSINKNGMKQFTFQRTVKANKKVVWSVISDVANYHKVAPNVDDVKIIEGQKQGMVRQCTHGKDSWSETCTSWQEEKSYAFTVNTLVPNYPYPLKTLKGTWEIEELADGNTTKINMYFDFTYKRRWQKIFLHPFFKWKFKKVGEQLLDNWQKIIEGNSK
jgi:ribosome-associated toxin RatA of RatAB toxin-antitoxin module